MDSLYCRIYGRVQMVMFRDFTTRKARKFKLVGFVRNLQDGSVETYAQGNHEALEEWLAKLHKGPILAHVERVDVQWNVPAPEAVRGETFDSFDILF